MHSEQLIVLYDGNCILCLKSVDGLSKLKTTVPLKLLPLQEADVAELFPGDTSVNDLLAQIHVIERQGEEQHVFRGPDAVVRILRTVPSLAWLEKIYRLPGCKSIASLLYRLIAKYRYQLFGKKDDCDSGACQIHRPTRKE
jgi:predicted DCC family thiol-disulfide oxidoreductase YuxK